MHKNIIIKRASGTLFILSALLRSVLLFGGIDYSVLEHSYVEVDFSHITGHHVTVGSNRDWKGQAPSEWNTFVYSSNEYIYKDAYGDDTGDGDYAYPTNKVFLKKTGGQFEDGRIADIVEFRTTYDATNLYFTIGLWEASPDPGGWWANALLIGIADDDPATGKPYFIQGDGSDPDKGPAAELNTKFNLDYTIFAASTYKIRMWNADGVKIGDGKNATNILDDGKLDNLQVKAPEWNRYEIAIPLSLIGPVAGRKFRFIVGSCFEEYSTAREVQGYPLVTEWYPTGGDAVWWNSIGPDPDIMDLIGASAELQQSDLANYTRLFNNPDESFEIFNADIRPYIFSPKEGQALTAFFTLSLKVRVTIQVKDLNNRIVRKLLDNAEVDAPASPITPLEYTWNGRDDRNALLKRGAYIVEFLFESGKERKTVRKVARIW